MFSKMESEHIIRRVYQSIKQEVITHSFKPGERLKIELLAEELRVSATPVREILNRLVAEGLIIMVPKMGFFMKGLLDSEIQDLYQLNQLLLQWAVSVAKKNSFRPRPCNIAAIDVKTTGEAQVSSRAPDQIAKGTAEFFSLLGSHSGNEEVCMRVANINDRLYYIRLHESELIQQPAEELDALKLYYSRGEFVALDEALIEYHELRHELLPNVMRMLKLSFQEEVEKSVI